MILKEFSDDFGDVEEDNTNKGETKGAEEKDLKITGPFNQIIPLFISTMVSKSKWQ